jgi:small GTP-binding protein
MIKKIKKERNEVRLLLIGPDNAGKTTILHHMFKMDVGQVAPTFGYQIHTLQYRSDRTWNLVIMDVGGQSGFRKYWSNYYERIDGIIFVVDCSSKESYDVLKAMDFDYDTPLLVFSNKFDLLVDKPKSVIKEFNANVRIFKDMMCSAKTGYNLKEGLDWIIRSIVNNEVP